MFTILHNPESAADADAALAALRNATWVAPSPAANAAGEVVIAFPGAKDALVLPGKGWVLSAERTNKNATAIYRRYSDGGLVFSVFIEKERACHSAAECLDASLKNPQYAKAAELTKSVEGPFAAARFFLDKPAGAPIYQADVQASALANGYWYDIHLSTAGDKRPDMERLLAVLRSISIRPADARP